MPCKKGNYFFQRELESKSKSNYFFEKENLKYKQGNVVGNSWREAYMWLENCD